jgi:hypothetical protein
METTGDFSISHYMKDLLCFAGQQMVFEEASQTVNKLTGAKVTGKQIERVCHHYGEKLEQEQQQEIKQGEKPVNYNNNLHYIELDGGMLLTREEGWKEMKLCRIFSDKDAVQVSKDRKQIIQSTYIGHLGSHKKFLEKVEQHTDFITRKAVLADGAPWIWNWAEDLYPCCIQILDFYHAKEHLCVFAQEQFKDPEQKQQWIDHHSLRLLNDQIEDVIKDLKNLKPANRKAGKMKPALIKYYQHNSKRMKYRTFKEQGLVIGSGAIEAAHRHVIQQRMKLSGQRWTINGAQQVANLRMMYKSNLWNKVHDIINKAA